MKKYADGKIKNKSLCQQHDFSNLVFELKQTTISPTDIDGFKEYQGKFGYILESKWGNNDINTAQDYAFTNMAKAMNKGGYNGGFYVIVANHNTAPSDDIDAGNEIVRKVYIYDIIENKGEWKSLQHENLSVRKVVTKLMKLHNIA